MNISRKEKKIYIELLRVIAIILVIFNHTDGYYSYFSVTTNLFTYLFSLIMSVICKINVPIFVMITGALLLEHEECLLKLFQKRVLRIVLITTIFSFLYYVIAVIRNGKEIFSVWTFLKGLLTGTIQESFWYLYVYMGIILLLPVLRKAAINMDDQEFKYLVIVQNILNVGIPFFTFITGLHVSSWINLLNIYVFYIFTGYYFDKRVKREKLEKNIKKIIISFFICVVIACMIVIASHFRNGNYEQQYLTMLTPLLAQGIFLIIRWICGKHNFIKKIGKIIIFLGGCTFGIYLMEQLARIQLLPMYLYLCNSTFGVFACLCYILASFLLALVYTIILKKIPGIRKLL